MSMKKKWMIFSLALALLGASSVGTAYAYFTTNARADGEYGIAFESGGAKFNGRRGRFDKVDRGAQQREFASGVRTGQAVLP